jgi:hypothetical protein
MGRVDGVAVESDDVRTASGGLGWCWAGAGRGSGRQVGRSNLSNYVET